MQCTPSFCSDWIKWNITFNHEREPQNAAALQEEEPQNAAEEVISIQSEPSTEVHWCRELCNWLKYQVGCRSQDKPDCPNEVLLQCGPVTCKFQIRFYWYKNEQATT